MEPIIIGIHGLANKPPQEVMQAWWKTAILEGLQKNCRVEAPSFEYQGVYWADLLYKYPQHDDPNYSFDSLYNDRPYLEARSGSLKEYRESLWDNLQQGTFEMVGKSVDSLRFRFEIEALSNWLLSRTLKDLQFYYDPDRFIQNRREQAELTRTVLRNELKQVIRNNYNRKIMVIGHSMGSIIAYDTLRDLGQSDSHLQIAHLITIGSPLGLPYVKSQIIKERGYNPVVRTPSIVTERWVNYADKRDVVAIDTHLSDDYQANKLGVKVKDDIVANDYVMPNGSNYYHSAYGYLRTPEISRHFKAFLGL